jgi:hypothetical protein
MASSPPASSLLDNYAESPLLATADSGRQNIPESAIPEGLLPAYLAVAFGELYEEDGLMVLGKGLGWLSLLAAFVRFYGDTEEGHVSILQDGHKLTENKCRLSLFLFEICFGSSSLRFEVCTCRSS